MSIINIYHKRSEPFHTCDEENFCKVELLNTLYKVVTERGRDRLNFRRSGDEKEVGFVVTFDKDVRGKKVYTADDETLETIVIPFSQAEGDYKYTISYPNDTEATVSELDPIIIIKRPSYLSSFFLVALGTASFVIGAAVSQLLQWHWF